MAAPEGALDRCIEAETRPAFLGVAQSFLGRCWRPRGGEGNDRAGLMLAQRLGCPEILGRLMAARGIDAETAVDHLAPSLRAFMPDPSRLLDMDRAAERLARAIVSGERIAIFGDYDVDGATATALLQRFLRRVGSEPLIHIPDRRRDGYGPNIPALLALKAAGAQVVVTVDCGTMAHEALDAAAAAGLDVIVADHHAAEAALPRAFAVVNPNRLDDTSGQGVLAAVGVVFLLLVAVNRTLRRAGRYASASAPEPDLKQWLDLVALGTVADVVPLTGLNRALVAQGLKVLAGRANAGLAALADAAKLAERPDAYSLGFLLGPRVNAGGRVGAADLGARLLATDDPIEAAGIAAQLEALNAERREIEAAVLRAALAQLDGTPSAGPVVIAHGIDWHPGVIGIVAARLKERYERPALAIAWDGAGEEALGRGSGRSVIGIDLGALIVAARQAGHLIAGGGHPMAAGFTLRRHALAGLQAMLAARMRGAAGGFAAVPTLGIDGALSVEGATLELVERLACLGPFGSGNAEPRFAIRNAVVERADAVGESHLRCILRGSAGGGGRLKAIAFRALETALGQGLIGAGGRPLHLAGHLRVDRWQGSAGTQLLIEDAAFAV